MTNRASTITNSFLQPGRKDLYNIKRRSVLEKEKRKAKPVAFHKLHLTESEYGNLKDIHQKLKNEINELRRECEKLKKQLANPRSKEEIVSNPSILQQLKNIARNKMEESDEQVTEKPRLSEEIDKSQDAVKPNNLHGADKRSEEEAETKALSIDISDLYFGHFALEEIGEFLPDDTAIFQKASYGDVKRVECYAFNGADI